MTKLARKLAEHLCNDFHVMSRYGIGEERPVTIKEAEESILESKLLATPDDGWVDVQTALPKRGVMEVGEDVINTCPTCHGKGMVPARNLTDKQHGGNVQQDSGAKATDFKSAGDTLTDDKGVGPRQDPRRTAQRESMHGDVEIQSGSNPDSSEPLASREGKSLGEFACDEARRLLGRPGIALESASENDKGWWERLAQTVASAATEELRAENKRLHKEVAAANKGAKTNAEVNRLLAESKQKLWQEMTAKDAIITELRAKLSLPSEPVGGKE